MPKVNTNQVLVQSAYSDSTKLKMYNRMIRSKATFNQMLEAYKNGHWTLNMPQTPGVYRGRARFTETGDTKIVIYELNGELQSHLPWGGYWWSEPEPEFPLSPDFVSD